jgi:hypothetical protein
MRIHDVYIAIVVHINDNIWSGAGAYLGNKEGKKDNGMRPSPGKTPALPGKGVKLKCGRERGMPGAEAPGGIG